MTPVRSCVACRGKGTRDTLVRLVAHPLTSEVVVDLGAKLPGRGAWIHARSACVDLVENRPSTLMRAFRTNVTCSDLRQGLTARVLNASLDGLSQAAAAGAVAIGYDLVAEAVASGRLVRIVLASDAAERTVRNVRRVASDVPVQILPVSRTEVGDRIGKGPVAVVGVYDRSSAHHLMLRLAWLRDLG